MSPGTSARGDYRRGEPVSVRLPFRSGRGDLEHRLFRGEIDAVGEERVHVTLDEGPDTESLQDAVARMQLVGPAGYMERHSLDDYTDLEEDK